jgi:hypothetical protein
VVHGGYEQFFVRCGALSLCDGWLVIDHRDLAMHVIVPPDGIIAMFDALGTWQVAT